MGSEHVSGSGVVDQEQWHPLLAALEFQRRRLKQEAWEERFILLHFSSRRLANPQLAKSYPVEGGLPSCICALAPEGGWTWF